MPFQSINLPKGSDIRNVRILLQTQTIAHVMVSMFDKQSCFWSEFTKLV